jgi:hypothetical protein
VEKVFKELFDLLGNKDMITLDSYFEHLFLKKDLKGLALRRY